MRKIINLEKYIKHKTTREWIEALIFAFIVALIFRTALYSPFKVPTGSMIPTIKIGDQLFANMHAYGLRIPFTNIKFFESPVQRGDIIIFPSPFDDRPIIGDDYIKRAVAIAGDKVEFRGELVYINDIREPSHQSFYDNSLKKSFFDPRTPTTKFKKPETHPFIVPEGKVWVMGDNRRNSLDSRFWGFLDENKIFAKGIFVFWNANPHLAIYDFSSASYDIGRIGTFLN